MDISFIMAFMEREDGYLIGDGLRIPWKQSEDMRNFKRLTMGHAVIVGKTTAVTLGYGERIPGRGLAVEKLRIYLVTCWCGLLTINLIRRTKQKF